MTGMPLPDSAGPTWTILIPTLGQRYAQFADLMARLMPQVDAAGGRVQVVAWWNNGHPPLAEIRQRLLMSVRTDYVSFIDDDDMVPADFVPSVLAALDERPDYVGWQVRYIADGVDRGLIDHSLRHGGWREERDPYRLLRDISHINPMRTAVAQRGDFTRGVRPGGIEDRPWVAQIRTTGLLKTEVYLPRPMYEYRWSRRGTAWRRPDKIRNRGWVMTPVDSPNFTYFSEERAVPLNIERKPIERLGVIVPTRGRPQNIERLIGAWDETGAWDDADLILAIDADDPANPGYWLIQQSVERPARILVHEILAWEPMVPKLNRVAVSLADSYDALAFAGDDHVPRTKGWARAYIDALNELGTGMVYGDDGYQGAKLSTEWSITSDVVRELGVMVPAPVEHLYCDNAIMELFAAAGALRHLPEVRIEHLNPYAGGKAETDEQYKRVNGKRQYATDSATYRRWQRTQRAAQVSAVRALRGSPDQPIPATVKLQREVRRMPRRSIFPSHFRQIRSASPEDVMVVLADLAAQVPADQEIVELGVFQGGTALRMAWAASQGNGAHLTGIDPWDLTGNVYDPPFTDIASERWARHWVQAFGYGDRIRLIKDFSADIAAVWNAVVQDRPVGLLFVDGDHTRAGARRDIEAWAPHLAEGAMIAVDDYGHPDWPGVAEAVDELVAEGFLVPIELYSDRLAVTRLAVTGDSGKDRGQSRAESPVTAITSEGVEPAPEPILIIGAEPDPVLDLAEGAPELSLGDLRRMARERGIPGASRMKEPELREALKL